MIETLAPLGREFYGRGTATVARELLGKLLVRRQPVGGVQLARIVEVEAYLGEKDGASHARRGPTPRAAIMFGPPGFLYVYFIYGMHHCMNFVTESDGVAGAVLIRAAEPIAGFASGEVELRSTEPIAGGSEPVRRFRGRFGVPRPLTGPGKLCATLGITLRDKGRDLTRPGRREALYVADDGSPAPRRVAAPRIGVDYAGEWAQRKLRYYVRDNPYVCQP